MKPRTRNTIIVVVVVLVALCCCGAVASAAIVGWFADWSYEWGARAGTDRERIERSFAVGPAPRLSIDAPAGSVTVRPGDEGTIQVIAVKKASRAFDLDLIEVSFLEQADGLDIEVRLSGSGFPARNSSVDLEIVAPPDTRLDLETDLASVDVKGLTGGVKVAADAGSVTLSDVGGLIEASTGLGMIEVRDAAGPVLLTSGAGLVVYEGAPRGECRFKTELGAIEIRLPANPDVEVDAETSLGAVELRCPVSGQVTSRQVKGIIGSGEGGTIMADSRMGAITITCR